jgi:ligand-binding sensor domain-containing protein
MKWIFCIAILVYVSACNGQNKTDSNTNPKLVKTKDTKISDNIHCGLEDNKGNMWFGTTGQGLYKYDGKSFTQFTTKQGLCNNYVWCLMNDNKGNIWCGTSNGVCIFDGEKFMPLAITTSFMAGFNGESNQNEWSTPNTVWSLLQDNSGVIWVGTGSGMYCYNGTSFTHFLQNDNVINNDSLKLMMVDGILQDKKGVIWFASGMPPGLEGVCRYDGKVITSSKPNGDKWIRTIVADKNDIIWFSGRQNGNFIFDGKQFKVIANNKEIGNVMLVDKKGNLWFTGGIEDENYECKNGIWCYDGKTYKNYNIKDGVGKYYVFCMIEDSKGNIWIGTRYNGLYMYNGKTFTSFSE